MSADETAASLGLEGLLSYLSTRARASGDARVWSNRGRVQLVGDEAGDRWFSVELARGESAPAWLVDAQELMLAPSSGPNTFGFSVRTVKVESGMGMVSASLNAPASGLYVWARTPPMRQAYAAAAARVAELREHPLLAAFLSGVLRSAEEAPGLVDGLSADQQDAVRLCCSPGLAAVWGPPGTGKTQVIAASLIRLVAEGKRVLVVSHTNIAIDNALQRAVMVQGGHPPGRYVRVGVPQLAAVAADRSLTLEGLLEKRGAAIRRRIAKLEAEQSVLAAGSDWLPSAASTGICAAADQFAKARDRYSALATRRMVASCRLARASATRSKVERLLSERQDLLAQLEAAAAAATHEQRQLRRLATYEENANGRIAESSQRGRVRQRLLPGSRERLQAEVEQWASRRSAQEAKTVRLERVKQERQTRLKTLERCLPDQSQIDRLRFAHTEAGRSATTLQAELRAAETEVGTMRQEMLDRVPEVAGKLAKLRNQLRRLERTILDEAAVVAATVTQLGLRPSLLDRHFDHVLIDEAASVDVGMVAYALTFADAGATLLGDFLQNQPIPESDLPAEMRPWTQTDCFELVGIAEPKDAFNRTGCARLTTQRRFGPAVTELANRVSYDGSLQWAGISPPAAQEIVVVDVDGLPADLTQVQHNPEGKGSRRWLMGALVSRAIAESCARDFDSVAVLTPYRPQLELLNLLLEDAASPSTIETSTVHSAQGREFEAVIFDTVEGGGSPGWIGRSFGGGSRQERNGTRVFNVAMTRSKGTTYVICSSAALTRARRGPLAELRRMLDHPGVHLVSLGAIVQRDVQHEPDAEADWIRAALQVGLSIDALVTEDDVYAALARRIRAAQESIYFWSPWVARRSKQVLPDLVAAAERGVKVTVFTRPEDKISPNFRPFVRRLLELPITVVAVEQMHQKIVIIDEVEILLGSQNLLSHSAGARGSREIMIAQRGRGLARSILEMECADAYARPPACGGCESGWPCFLSRKGNWRCGECGWESPARPPSRRSLVF